MANNYILFSEMIDEITPDESAWIEERIEEHGKAQDEDAYDYDEDNRVMDFSYELRDKSLWIYSEEGGNVDCVCDFVHKFLSEFRPDGEFYLNYAWTCSKPRLSEFGGGKAKVTANGWTACCGDCVDD